MIARPHQHDRAAQQQRRRADADAARGPASTRAVPRRADGQDQAHQHRQTLREMRDSHHDRKSDRKQRQQKSGSRPEPAVDHLAALTNSIELSVLIHLDDLQEPFGLGGVRSYRSSPGSRRRPRRSSLRSPRSSRRSPRRSPRSSRRSPRRSRPPRRAGRSRLNWRSEVFERCGIERVGLPSGLHRLLGRSPTDAAGVERSEPKGRAQFGAGGRATQGALGRARTRRKAGDRWSSLGVFSGCLAAKAGFRVWRWAR